jgi:hypothetical protein
LSHTGMGLEENREKQQPNRTKAAQGNTARSVGKGHMADREEEADTGISESEQVWSH